MKVFRQDEGLPIKCWSETPEQGAIDQAFNLAKLPFAYKHIALMPDVHQGYGMPIGGVFASLGSIVPNAVGVDIGCGMCFASSNLPISEISKIKLKAIVETIKATIPVGFKSHEIKQSRSLLVPPSDNLKIVKEEFEKSLFQLGTLGGGNHFIELQKTYKDRDGNEVEHPYLHIMIHSGSRQLGMQVATEYNKAAHVLNETYFSKVPRQWDLAFLPMETELGTKYYNEMMYCMNWASTNRALMLERVKNSILSIFPDTQFDTAINIPHNFARLEHHFGRNVMVHRKGATAARWEELGIVPGSQGTSSFIISGKAHEDSFMSCSHGAGRKMGRRQAQKVLNLEEEKAKLDSQDILHNINEIKDLDEASGAYKDINTVIAEQSDMINVVLELKPIAVIKGN